ncbi:MAG: 23S rRNA (adenine(2503)-C(2))-methyltransferase RlmN [Alistipes sp.]|nr:23S rRNA (adenine(2503)-C(2))-methyltransferase RlmN [Alistipes sp.]
MNSEPEHREPLCGMTPADLERVVGEAGLPRFAAGQIARRLYRHFASDIAEMTELPMAARERLSERYCVGLSAPLRVDISCDGTRKYLYGVSGGYFVETAYIPDGERATLCVSCQAGCRMGCKFCATGRRGLRRSLTSGEILNQIISLPERDRLTNIVFMGMGEPFDNLDEVLRALEILTSDKCFGRSPSRITVSTAGVTANLRRFLESTDVRLAVSLHNPFSDERSELMPIERAYPIEEFMEILREYDFSHRRVSFEYILLSGLNDTPRHIRGLCRLLNGIKCRINIIRFHRIPGSPYFSPDDAAVMAFRDALTARGIMTTVRASRGEDIKAACGLLDASAAESES